MKRFASAKLGAALFALVLAACTRYGGAQWHWSADGKALYRAAAGLPKPAQYARALRLLEDSPSAENAQEHTEIAVQLLTRAATPAPSAQYIYSPPVGNESYGQVIRIPSSSSDPGLVGAQYMLGALYAEGAIVERDLEAARSWLSKAAAQGSVPAAARLAALGAAAQ
ncbi:MAG: hypothetical protein AAF862_12420 [Pseudomonadota bacterium]